jgi:hypothetical protein
MKLVFTSDIPDTARNRLISEWEPFAGTAECKTIEQLGIQSPSYVQLVAAVLTWENVLKVGAVLFLKEIVKEAGKLTGELMWVKGTETLRRLSASLVRLQRDAPRHPTISIGIPIPDEYETTRLTFAPGTEENVAMALSCFAAQVRGIEAFVRRAMESGALRDGPVHLILQADGSFRAQWVDLDSGEEFSRVVPREP